MTLSVFDLFSIGIGPSSSHTVGPMRAALRFASGLSAAGDLPRVARITVDLFGSLGATGHGHGTVPAIVLGLMGHAADTVDPRAVGPDVDVVRSTGRLDVLGTRPIGFDPERDIVLHPRDRLPAHSNAMRFLATDADGTEVASTTLYSIGGGFVVDDAELHAGSSTATVPYPFATSADLMACCARSGLSIAEVMAANEAVLRPPAAVRAGLVAIWDVMRECVANGITTQGVLPGGLRVPRRAPDLRRRLESESDSDDPLRGIDWVTLFALAVSEENAAGGRVVTAPTNGAAGVIPAVLHYYTRFVPLADVDGVVTFLLTAGAVGMIFKTNASISGAEVGCQGEVGAACSMAAAGMAAVMGGSPSQCENAAEIGMEHNLGLTCDPIGGLVQIPCIERNAIAAVKAITAARTALRGDGRHIVSLDRVIETMRDTGRDMSVKYKETSTGGLAVTVIEC